MKIVEVLIEHASHSLNRPFSYIYNGSKNIVSGVRVLLDFNFQELVGYVLNVKESNKTKEELEEELGFSLSEIKDVIDDSPLLSDELLSLADEISKYYLAPKISVLQAMLPKSLSPRKSSLKAPKIAYDQYLEVKDDAEDDLTAKQIEVLRMIKEEGLVLKKEIKSISIVNKLIEKGKLEIKLKEKRRLKLPEYNMDTPKDLTIDQMKVIDEFNNSSDLYYLLQGVTGSGKTEVYLRLSFEYLSKGKSVLMLVPEISLTPMMMEYFIKRFNNKIAILHSELTPAEKYDEYRKIASGEVKIVVGARSAIFAPLKDLGLIILDEEHVETYKQDTLPFYHAREVAIMRSKLTGAKLIMGSATPSLETRIRADKKIYHLLRLNKRINNKPLPKTTIVNMLDYKNFDRESSIFSYKLRESISNVLAKNQQVILLLNRRGFSTNVTCRKCGKVFKCPDCGIALTYHKKSNMLKCHHCDHIEVLEDNCPDCGSKYLMKTGFGTEKVEEEVKRLFPNVRTLRLDSDSAKIRSKVAKVVTAFGNKEADILIGTQMIAKGHNFPDVTLVGIVLADIGLNMPSYRSSERVFQLVTQAIGRSGRSDKVGEAIIQTYAPSHYAITLAARQDYETFYLKEMGFRKLQKFPPYTLLCSVNIASKNEELAVRTIYQISETLKQNLIDEDVIILGPITPYIPYEGNSYKRSLLIKFKKSDIVKKELEKILASLINKTQISITINFDPYDY
jgi:primosomal protein N' (replication factor Y)